ncbi:hypothetical protein [Catalinimonas niigatensis]|uniref:hypothetical protein n=1 Tax=Catalinimonas niigatensis TaxID=1397264 RepID=UPI002666D7ED|nr:hypothetical protein [Catalinimonas niigatensis]WPP51444.1 hypothetical protein PZB72_03460 [Catalinimonas niigatensis]
MKYLITLFIFQICIIKTFSQTTIEDVAVNICECVNEVDLTKITEEAIIKLNQKCFQVHCSVIQDSLAVGNNLSVENVLKHVYLDLTENCESLKFVMTSMAKYKLPAPEYDSRKCINYRNNKVIQILDKDESIIDFRSDNSKYSINWISECDYEFIVKDKLGPLNKGEKITFTFIGVKADTSYYNMNMKGVQVTVKQTKIE